jgi:hypothetical protein
MGYFKESLPQKPTTQTQTTQNTHGKSNHTADHRVLAPFKHRPSTITLSFKNSQKQLFSSPDHPLAEEIIRQKQTA